MNISEYIDQVVTSEGYTSVFGVNYLVLFATIMMAGQMSLFYPVESVLIDVVFGRLNLQ